MFKAPDHQVAGHQALNGTLGPLIDDSGRFYKPLQNDGRGSIELAFYESFSSNTSIPDHIHKFFPIFYGSQVLQASDGSGPLPHIVLQDFVSSRINSSIMDIKMGSRTWYPQASENYVAKCLEKDRESTSPQLGFRISGLRVYGTEDSGIWKPSKKEVQGYTVEDVRLVLRKFVSTNPNLETDCAFASTVYGGQNGILAQLKELKEWFEDQTMYQFNSCSVLMVYDKEFAVTEIKSSDPAVKLIDFAHVIKGEGVIDHNFLGGLCSLIKFISEIVTTCCPKENTTEA